MKGRLVVVGCGGFVGHRICHIARDFDVIGVSRTNPVRQPDVGELIIADRCDPHLVANLLAMKPAAWIDTAVFDEPDAEAVAVGCGKARANGVALPRFVFTSTIGECSPALATGTVVSGSSAIMPDDSHAEGKVRAFRRLERELAAIDAVWALLPQMWGPSDHPESHPGGRTRIALQNIIAGKAIRMPGNCGNSIPDGFVDTIAEALIHLACLKAGPGTGLTRMALSGSGALTPRLWIETAAAALGKPAVIETCPPDAADEGCDRIFPGRDVITDTTALYESGFRQSTDWRAGIEYTANAFASELQGNRRCPTR